MNWRHSHTKYSKQNMVRKILLIREAVSYEPTSSKWICICRVPGGGIQLKVIWKESTIIKLASSQWWMEWFNIWKSKIKSTIGTNWKTTATWSNHWASKKAFDKIQHPFRIKSPGEMRDTKDIIKLFYRKHTANINLNGGKLETSLLKSGTRKGCSLFPYLFIIGLEVSAKTLGRLKEMKGIPIGKEKSKYLHLQMIWFYT